MRLKESPEKGADLWWAMCANGVSETGGAAVNRNSFIGCFQKECFSGPDRSPGVFNRVFISLGIEP